MFCKIWGETAGIGKWDMMYSTDPESLVQALLIT